MNAEKADNAEKAERAEIAEIAVKERLPWTKARTPMDWARAACEAIMAEYGPMELPPTRRWHYHQGVFLRGMERLAEATGDGRCDDYIRRYVDGLVDENGNFYFARDELDAIQAGLLLFRLHERTGHVRYRKAADKLRGLYRTLNRTSEGGFWHKDKYPYQMWLDGLYMGGVFALAYANAFGDAEELREQALLQERLMRMHMRDPLTGLYYHAWDESRRMPWANPETGNSPEFWGRSVGWYALALTQYLDLLPSGEPAVAELEETLRDLLRALIRCQDRAGGLWYQVLDKGDRPDNWTETSCSSLFVYALARGVKRGIVGTDGLESARRGYRGLLRAIAEASADGAFTLPRICIGTSAGDYENYVTRPTSRNDLHGVGAFAMASAEMHELMEL